MIPHAIIYQLNEEKNIIQYIIYLKIQFIPRNISKEITTVYILFLEDIRNICVKYSLVDLSTLTLKKSLQVVQNETSSLSINTNCNCGIIGILEERLGRGGGKSREIDNLGLRSIACSLLNIEFSYLAFHLFRTNLFIEGLKWLNS